MYNLTRCWNWRAQLHGAWCMQLVHLDHSIRLSAVQWRAGWQQYDLWSRPAACSLTGWLASRVRVFSSMNHGAGCVDSHMKVCNMRMFSLVFCTRHCTVCHECQCGFVCNARIHRYVEELRVWCAEPLSGSSIHHGVVYLLREPGFSYQLCRQDTMKARLRR